MERIAKPKGFDDDEDRDEILLYMDEKMNRRTDNRDKNFVDISLKAKATTSKVEDVKLMKRSQNENMETEMPLDFINKMRELGKKRKLAQDAITEKIEVEKEKKMEKMWKFIRNKRMFDE